MLEIAAWLGLGVAAQVWAARRLLTFLHILQQEEYDAQRFARWCVAQRACDRKATVATMGWVAVALAFPSGQGLALSMWGLALTLCVLAAREPNPVRAAKKKLMLTARARRMLWVAHGIVAALVLSGWVLQAPLWAWILLWQAMPVCLVVAVWLLRPYEARVNQRLIQEARDRLAALRPRVVGVTGSFGKTSVKHILGHILGSQAPALVTPGSVNTELGITRIVREKLMARDRFFVCEMGAYGVGSIARLCRLAPPQVGVITAIGHAHYERFKSLETVAQAKFELAQAVLAVGGPLIVNEAVLSFAVAAECVQAHRAQVVVVGSGPQADARILATRQTAQGVEIDLVWQGVTRTLHAPLFGAHHGLNMALAFVTAVVMGLDPEQSDLALRSAPQIKHRSEVLPHASGAAIIDDAYNSNPSGFASGLALLDVLRDGGRRILITPGMVELGAAHDAEHARLGALAAQHVDVLVPVVPERLTAMVAAYQAHASHGQVLPQPTMQAALAWMNEQVRAGDAVLIENDLPDLYEAKIRL